VLLLPLAADSVKFDSGKSILDEFRETVNLLMTRAAKRIVGAHVRASTNKFNVKAFRSDLTTFQSSEYAIIATVVAHG
jgi:hypothetical protein